MPPQAKVCVSPDDNLSISTDRTPILENTSPLGANTITNSKAYDHNKNVERLTFVLSILVFLDMFGVGLVVPLLNQYYRLAGVQDSKQRELLSSLYSCSQIGGGLLWGVLSDTKYMSRKNILLLSFVGSAFAYSLITVDGDNNNNLYYIMCSRIVVGFVKQTMTISSAMIASATRRTTNDSNSNATNMARVSASSTFAWIIGPSVGSLLYKHVGTYAPIYLSCALFLMNVVLTILFLPTDNDAKSDHLPPTDKTKQPNISRKQKNTSSVSQIFHSFLTKIHTCFQSRELASVVMSTLVFQWVTRTTTYQGMASFYEEKYGIEPYQRGYLRSYGALLAFIVQSFGIQSLLTYVGSQRYAVCIASIILTVLTLLEIKLSSLVVFVLLFSPLITICTVLLSISLKSLQSQCTSKETIGSVFAVIDVLQNVVSVGVPFYRATLFTLIERISSNNVNTGDFDKRTDSKHLMVGDPNPSLWLISSTVHWAVASTAFCCLLLLYYGSKNDSSNRSKTKTS